MLSSDPYLAGPTSYQLTAISCQRSAIGLPAITCRPSVGWCGVELIADS